MLNVEVRVKVKHLGHGTLTHNSLASHASQAVMRRGISPTTDTVTLGKHKYWQEDKRDEWLMYNLFLLYILNTYHNVILE